MDGDANDELNFQIQSLTAVVAPELFASTLKNRGAAPKDERTRKKANVQKTMREQARKARASRERSQ